MIAAVCTDPVDQKLVSKVNAIRMHTFKKEERLCSKKSLDLLFHNGSSFILYPFRITYLVQPVLVEHIPAEVVIAVAKRRYKRAVDRNLVKRRIKEAYRLNKSLSFYEKLPPAFPHVLLSINYVGKEIYPFEFMQKKLLKAFDRLTETLQKDALPD